MNLTARVPVVFGSVVLSHNVPGALFFMYGAARCEQGIVRVSTHFLQNPNWVCAKTKIRSADAKWRAPCGLLVIVDAREVSIRHENEDELPQAPSLWPG